MANLHRRIAVCWVNAIFRSFIGLAGKGHEIDLMSIGSLQTFVNRRAQELFKFVFQGGEECQLDLLA